MNTQPQVGAPALMEFLNSKVQNPALSYQLLRDWKRSVPQINEYTKIRVVPGRPRTINIPQYQQDWVPMPTKITYVPQTGLVAALKRLRARIHKWFVDHEHHPADRPRGWQPYNISRIGMKAIDSELPLVVNSSYRTLEFKRSFIGLSDRGMPLDLGNPFQMMIVWAYDALDDTLYVQE